MQHVTPDIAALTCEAQGSVKGGKRSARTAYLIPGRACTLGGGRDSDRAWLSKELLFLFLFFLQPWGSLGAVVLTSSNRGRAKFESRGMEGTDVLRTTRSTFW